MFGFLEGPALVSADVGWLGKKRLHTMRLLQRESKIDMHLETRLSKYDFILLSCLL